MTNSPPVVLPTALDWSAHTRNSAPPWWPGPLRSPQRRAANEGSKRPAVMMPAHRNRDRPQTTLAWVDASTPGPHSSTCRASFSSNQSAFRPASRMKHHLQHERRVVAVAHGVRQEEQHARDQVDAEADEDQRQQLVQRRHRQPLADAEHPAGRAPRSRRSGWRGQ